ncbi:MAG: rubrerythrin family protein [Candidatus Geothermincolia bacterium]
MHPMTAANLKEAFAGESQAHMRYILFAERAAAEGFPEMARMFKAIAFAERIHARNHYEALEELAGSPANIANCIAGENYEIEEMYPAFRAVAQLQGESAAIQSTYYALEAEKIHAAMYSDALSSIGAGSDLTVGTLQICDVCGHTREGEAPDKCPICSATREHFREF